MFRSTPDEPDESDLVISEVPLRSVDIGDRRKTHALHVTEHIADWFEHRHDSRFFLFGYPREQNGVEFEDCNITTNQYLLTGRYDCRSTTSFSCHTIGIDSTQGLESLSGLSGSPVYCVPTGLGYRTAPYFCGIALRGSAASGRLHFLDSERILATLDSKCKGLFVPKQSRFLR